MIEKVILAASTLLWGAIVGRRAIERPLPVRIEPDLVPLPVIAAPRGDDRIPIRRSTTYLSKRIVTPAAAVEVLIDFMHAHDATGYFTAKEIDQFWGWCVESEDICPLPATAVREAMRRYRVGQTRLSDVRYAQVRLRNPRIVRPVLYKIPKVQVASDSIPDRPDALRASPGPSVRSPDREPQTVRAESQAASRRQRRAA